MSAPNARDVEFSESKSNYEPIVKNSGSTLAEKYLGKLCEKTFLSLWSYPGVFRNQGQAKPSADGKEICDLLVVFGEHIIIFSDKQCAFQTDVGLELAWRRWFKRAIAKSAEQAWGAKRWIEQQTSRVFLDKKCTQPLPVPLPESAKAKIHLIVVAHGISNHIVNRFGGTGSVLIDSALCGFQNHTRPFYVGDLEGQKPFVHVFDDHSLRTVMATRDTISDFVDYLEKRERLLRSPTKIVATGEEELLPFYLRNINRNGEHDFVFPNSTTVSGICIEEGHWHEFQRHPQRIAQLHQDQISYVWDSIIERFNFYALRGEQYFVSDGGIKDAEKILRFMAREPRHKRRALALSLKHMFEATPPHKRMLRLISPIDKGDPYYVLLLFPLPNRPNIDEEYRKVRSAFLEACCWVVRLLNPQAEDIVGIATESGTDGAGRSEDACYFDGRHWTEEMAEHARKAQADLGILVKPIQRRLSIDEYPYVPMPGAKIGRNERCPCGSGKKYKKCCLNK